MDSTERITLGRGVIFLYLALGFASIYRGFTTGDPDSILGLDSFIWLGILFFMAGIAFWYEWRSEQNDGAW